MDTTAVILAVASPPGRSPRGIVRASGVGTFELLAPHAKFPRSRGAHRARLRVAGLDAACVVLAMPAPGSYTGQDSAEIQLPGNPWLLERVIDALIVSGGERGMDARRAEPGEFTARAFLDGRLGLTEAEGVAATIAARSDAELRAARLLTGGRLGGLARGLADELASALALVEAGIDFTDQEDVVAIAPADLRARIQTLRRRIDEHLRRAVGTEQLESIPWVVFCGPPNAGKSTLFNALLGRTRAVVSNAPGTTRDVLAEPLALGTGGAEVMLADLAGADDDPSQLNLDMQAAARAARDRAELVIECVPVEAAPPSPDRAAPQRLVVRTMCDLGPAEGGLPVSARTGAGLDELRSAIAERLGGRAVSLAADALALRPRHEAALRSAREDLDRTLELVEPAMQQRHLPAPELVAACLRSALDELAGLAGDVTPDDVLGRIFGEFCVGK